MLRKQLEGEEANAAVLAVDVDELEKEPQVLQRRAMLTGAATSTCGARVFHLMLESLTKQMEEKPEFMAPARHSARKHGRTFQHGECGAQDGHA